MRVEELTGADWRVWRDLRLEALADTPIGFGELHADVAGLPDEEWQSRMARPGTRFVAYDGHVPVGMAGGFQDDTGQPILVAVYVSPAARGRGAVDALVEAVASWAAPDRLVLDVHEDNRRAQRAYARLGFVETGERGLGMGIDGRDLLRMRLP